MTTTAILEATLVPDVGARSELHEIGNPFDIDLAQELAVDGDDCAAGAITSSSPADGNIPVSRGAAISNNVGSEWQTLESSDRLERSGAAGGGGRGLDARARRAALGLGGRDRRSASTVERARASVRLAIRGALDKISEEHPALGRHLERFLKTGTFCCWIADPERRTAWEL